MPVTEVVGLFFVIFGFMLGALNWVLSIKRVMNKGGASAIFWVSLVLVFIGSIFLKDQSYKIYLWAILLIDFTAVPLLLMQSYKFLFKTERG